MQISHPFLANQTNINYNWCVSGSKRAGVPPYSSLYQHNVKTTSLFLVRDLRLRSLQVKVMSQDKIFFPNSTSIEILVCGFVERVLSNNQNVKRR